MVHVDLPLDPPVPELFHSEVHKLLQGGAPAEETSLYVGKWDSWCGTQDGASFEFDSKDGLALAHCQISARGRLVEHPVDIFRNVKCALVVFDVHLDEVVLASPLVTDEGLTGVAVRVVGTDGSLVRDSNGFGGSIGTRDRQVGVPDRRTSLRRLPRRSGDSGQCQANSTSHRVSYSN